MALPMPPERDIPVPHPPNDVRGVGSAEVATHTRAFPPPRRWMDVIGYVPQGAEVATEDEYVRTYWAALVGTAALEDLLRLAAAAQRNTRLRRPSHIHVLITEGLVHPIRFDVVAAPVRLPLLDESRLRRLPLPLQSRHRREHRGQPADC